MSIFDRLLHEQQMAAADAEVARILAMTDEELILECLMEGTTVEEEAARCREILQRAVESVRIRQSGS